MTNELASANDYGESNVASRIGSTASRLFEEVAEGLFASKKGATTAKTDAVQALDIPTESAPQEIPNEKGGPSGAGATTEKIAPAPVGRGDTRATAGSGGGGHASGFGRRHGTPSTYADEVADNMKEHPIVTGNETLLFPPLVILDTEIRKAVDKPVSRTGR